MDTKASHNRLGKPMLGTSHDLTIYPFMARYAVESRGDRLGLRTNARYQLAQCQDAARFLPDMRR